MSVCCACSNLLARALRRVGYAVDQGLRGPAYAAVDRWPRSRAARAFSRSADTLADVVWWCVRRAARRP